MNAPLARLGSAKKEVRPDLRPNRRKEARYSAWIDAILESSHGDKAEVQLSEISLHGCRAKSDDAWLRTGSFVSIDIDGAQTLQAIVRWVRDGYAGMEFLRPVPPECRGWHDLMDMPY